MLIYLSEKIRKLNGDSRINSPETIKFGNSKGQGKKQHTTPKLEMKFKKHWQETKLYIGINIDSWTKQNVDCDENVEA